MAGVEFTLEMALTNGSGTLGAEDRIRIVGPGVTACDGTTAPSPWADGFASAPRSHWPGGPQQDWAGVTITSGGTFAVCWCPSLRDP